MYALRVTARRIVLAAFIAFCCMGGIGANRTYRNPVLFADYSDPDVVRAGEDFFMVSSSFQVVPGLPILHSTDLLNWTIIGHAIERLPSPRYDTPQNGGGIWAPSIRFHEGFFWIYYGDPDLGVFMTKARDPRGPWDKPVLVKEALGWIDPCPLWEPDGTAFLVHAWAKSRAGFNSILTVHRMSPDGTRVLDEGVPVFDGRDAHPTIEGPKFYRRDGYYYIFAPAGGVKTGWQTVLRSRNPLGPYEARIVLDQGKTGINGPHQGAWIDTPSGESWFVHFQDRGAYGRIIHLQPMRWISDWPVIGADSDENGRGEPVTVFRAPDIQGKHPVKKPQTSDEFGQKRLGLQWQWNANPLPSWWSLSARPGVLRLFPGELVSSNLWDAPNLLMQKFPDEMFTATALIDPASLSAGDRAGLLVMGLDYAYVAIRKNDGGWQVRAATCRNADQGTPETVEEEMSVAPSRVHLRVAVAAGASCRFSYSFNGSKFTTIGRPFTAREGRWIGARVGLFASGSHGTVSRGSVDVDWFRIVP